jgi:hypothetical protein
MLIVNQHYGDLELKQIRESQWYSPERGEIFVSVSQQIIKEILICNFANIRCTFGFWITGLK